MGTMANNYVLIADPDLVAAQVYLAGVREVGLATAVVRDGAQARSTMSFRGSPALLICELALPNVDAFELIEGLRRTVPESMTPVIVVSAHRAMRDLAAEQRQRLGISAIMARAATDESVRRVIRRLLGVPEEPPTRAAHGLAAFPIRALARLRAPRF
ncbi:Phytochrome-like protein [Minicystis rosea]|nr:Phytochrome-like protein [Minicystis rosea]